MGPGFPERRGLNDDRGRYGAGVSREVPILGQMIRLGQLLKLAGVAGSGSETKVLLADGAVLVNGEPEARRGRQLHGGDVVHVGHEDLVVAAPPAVAPPTVEG